MDIETFRAYCLSLSGVFEDLPFGPDVLVFKVGGKMFAGLNLDSVPPRVNLKAEPETNRLRRERYAGVRPGYHMNKEHWNTVDLDGQVPAPELRLWVEESYALVRNKLPKAVRQELDQADQQR
jgi:predicted DNA-binding protein (MmcQ/YjbR family)